MVTSSKLKHTAYTTLVRPILEYSATAWDPYTQKNIRQLEQVQRNAARFISHNYDRTPGTVTNLLQELNLDSLEQRRKQQRLSMMYKIVNELVDINQDRYLQKAQTRTRGSHSSKFQTISTRTDTFKYSFFPRTIVDWNSLPNNILESPSLSTFKERLKHD